MELYLSRLTATYESAAYDMGSGFFSPQGGIPDLESGGYPIIPEIGLSGDSDRSLTIS